MKFNREMLRAYFVCGTQNCQGNALEIIEQALIAGITLFQFREKGAHSLSGEEKRTFARQAQNLCRNYGVPFIVNDDIELAIELDADGVHLGQGDMPVEVARQFLPDKIIGLSISTPEEYRSSNLAIVDYIGIGPIYPTHSKEDAKPAIGPLFIRTMRQLHPHLPIVAIGGIQLQHIPEILQKGADGVAVISLIACAHNISEVVGVMLHT
ncbi:MAG: thiamine phosphate synthase [Aerococcaceae bacterium]|nr:thiamine phosphate synthase [Aerococcaceae bacterium]